MSSGGIFTLLTNDGKQDRLIMASELLKVRLANIANSRASRNLDPTPTLRDIEKSHVLFMNSHFKPFAALGFEYNKVRVSSGPSLLGGSVRFSIPNFGDFFHDMVLHVVLSPPSISGGTNPTYRWCSYTGERLMKKVSFSVNGNNLDEYYSRDYVCYRQFELPTNKKIGYMRCMGEEVPLSGEFLQSRGSAATNSRICGDYRAGPQTPATSHPNLDLMIPLLFWFNRDVSLAVPSVSIPFGQRFIDITFAEQRELVGIENRGTSSGGTLGNDADILLCELYINNIFVNPEVHDIFIKRIGFTLIRVYRHQTTRLTTSSSNIVMNNIKWPIEKMYIGFQPSGNADINNNDAYGAGNQINHLDHWHIMSKIARTEVSGNPLGVLVDIPSATVDTMSITAQGLPLYDIYNYEFYSNYLPLIRGKKTNTPSDSGLCLVSFAIKPDKYQPSGHLNVSRAREFYVDYSSGVRTDSITASNTVDLHISATAINFLIISDGSAVLRYAT